MNLKMIWGAGLLIVILLGCGQTKIGKLPVIDGKLPPFFDAGEIKAAEVLDRFGEPLRYREYQDRSVMMYEYRNTQFAFLPTRWDNYRIFLIFENNILKKTEVQELSWKFELGN